MERKRKINLKIQYECIIRAGVVYTTQFTRHIARVVSVIPRDTFASLREFYENANDVEEALGLIETYYIAVNEETLLSQSNDFLGDYVRIYRFYADFPFVVVVEHTMEDPFRLRQWLSFHFAAPVYYPDSHA